MGISLDHVTKFENATFDEFCGETRITHNFLAPRTPQQNGVWKGRIKTLVNIARSLLIDRNISNTI